MPTDRIGRWLLEGGELVPGYIEVVDGFVQDVCRRTPPSDSTCAVILPSFVNAHTHIGDAFAHPAPPGTVEAIVGPGGYKHRMLASVSAEEKAAGMMRAIDVMSRSGTSAFVDYREEGMEGVRAAGEALKDRPIHGTLLGRPASADATGDEIDDLLKECDGLAFSSVSDWPMEILSQASRSCRRDGKLFSLHASEARREPIEDVLDLKPDFIVHMTAATDEDLVACAEADVPIVVCPSSNAFFGINPGINRMLDSGVTVALGTDNAMICWPDMLAEMRVAYELCRRSWSDVSATDVIHLATLSGRKVLNAEGQITTEMSVSDDLTAVDVEGKDPLLELVSSPATGTVSAVFHRGRMRRLKLG